MSVVRVAVPVLQGKRKFHFDKGRPWSILEHLLLAAFASKPATAHELAERSDMPQRVVIEAIIRLMRAGWVEMIQEATGISFHITADGLAAVGLTELPNAPRRLSRNMTFVVDQITGTVFRSRDFPFLHQHMVNDRATRENIVYIARPQTTIVEGMRPLIEALFQDDEKFISMDQIGDRLAERWSLVTVRDGEPDGLTRRAPQALIDAVVEAASKARRATSDQIDPIQSAVPILPQIAVAAPKEHRASFSANDLILGGQEHHESFIALIKRARHRILIHSTFIAVDRFDALLPNLKHALSLGVKIDVMWGQDGAREGQSSTRDAVARLREKIQSEQIENLTVHPFSTRSHCKIIVADEGTLDRMVAYVGSCNWLYSQFGSFEATVRLRESEIVADVVDQLAELSRTDNGHWTDLAIDLTALAEDLRSAPSAGAGRAMVSIVTGPQHAALIRDARDTCQKRLFVTSHRFGAAARTVVLAPVLAAAKEREIEVEVYYGTKSGPVSGVDVAEMTLDASLSGVQIRPVKKPRLHAKIVAWDDDAVVITSQNWLSADPSDDNPRQEIGVCIRSPGIARILISRFNAARME